MRQRRAFVLAGLMLVCLAAQNCGYSTRSLVRPDIHTVYVPVASTQSFRRGHEKSLTAAVVDELTRHSNLQIVPSEEADSILRLRVVDLEERVVTKTEADRIVHKRVRVTVRVEWKDTRTGRDIIPPQEISRTGRYVPGLGEPKFEAALRDVAQAIVEKTWKSW